MAKQKRSSEYYEHITEYQSTPEQKKRRAARGRARYAYQKEHGAIPKGLEVHHVKHSKHGELDNNMSNLELKTRYDNMIEMNHKFNKGKSNGKKELRSRTK